MLVSRGRNVILEAESEGVAEVWIGELWLCVRWPGYIWEGLHYDIIIYGYCMH